MKKPTRFLTNSEHIGKALSLRCTGQHRHIELTGGGRTRRSEVYPDALCRAILTGLVNQMNHDDRIGCSFKPEEVSINVGAEDDDEGDGDDMNINEVNFDVNGGVDDQTITRVERTTELRD